MRIYMTTQAGNYITARAGHGDGRKLLASFDKQLKQTLYAVKIAVFDSGVAGYIRTRQFRFCCQDPPECDLMILVLYLVVLMRLKVGERSVAGGGEGHHLHTPIH